MTKKQLFISVGGVAAGVLAALLIVPAFVAARREPPQARAQWAQSFQTLRNMAQGVDTVVLAEVLTTQPTEMGNFAVCGLLCRSFSGNQRHGVSQQPVELLALGQGHPGSEYRPGRLLGQHHQLRV